MLTQSKYFPEVWDSSMIATAKACPQLLKKIYFDHWKSKGFSNIHLHAGGAFAHGVEAVRRRFYENGESQEDSITWGLIALLEFYGDFDAQDAAKDLVRMAGALVYYFDMYPLNHDTAYPILLPGGKRAIEFSFAHPLPIDHPITGQPLLYCGRLDAINSFAGGNWGFDEKTTSSLGPTWSQKWDLRAQFPGYVWGGRESGIPISGIVVRGVSILKESYDTKEAIVYEEDWKVNRWYTETLEWLEDIIRWWKTGRFKYNLDETCSKFSGCGFAIVCKSQNEEPWLETYFEKRHWNPITREETKL